MVTRQLLVLGVLVGRGAATPDALMAFIREVGARVARSRRDHSAVIVRHAVSFSDVSVLSKASHVNTHVAPFSTE